MVARSEGPDSAAAIFWRFLRFGALAWGGPAAQIAMIKHECVDEEHWVSEEVFKKTLAVYQVLPGPEAHELCVYFGRLRGGRLGAFLAGLAFMLPGFVLMLAVSVLYVQADIAEDLDALFYGLKAAVGALIARAVVRLGRTFITDVPLALIAVAAFAVTVFASASFAVVLLGAGLAYELWINAERWTGRANSLAPVALVAAAGLSLNTKIFGEGLKAGLLTFGGAYTVIPFLQASAVDAHGWLTAGEFVDGLALSGVLPAPLIIFSTFVGYLAGGMPGALLMTLGIFLPAFMFPIFLHRQLVALAENRRIRPLLLGVTVGVIGLIAAVAIDVVETSVVDVPTALLALGAFLILNRYHGKLTVLYVVVGCGVVGRPSRPRSSRPIFICRGCRQGHDTLRAVVGAVEQIAASAGISPLVLVLAPLATELPEKTNSVLGSARAGHARRRQHQRRDGVPGHVSRRHRPGTDELAARSLRARGGVRGLGRRGDRFVDAAPARRDRCAAGPRADGAETGYERSSS